MPYRKLIFQIAPFEEWFRDLLIAGLGEAGFDSFVELPDGFEGYISDSLYDPSFTNQIPLLHDTHFAVAFKEELVENKNWNEEWEKNYFKPLLIAGRCLVRAPFHSEYPVAKIEIVIEPNMAFGTGNHETTSLMMEALLSEGISGKTVLDMGCGTGILSILASKLGAGLVTAIDVDEWATQATSENSAMNGVSGIKVFRGDASLLTSGNYDLILANIQRNVILNDLPAYQSVLKQGGKLLLSGFYASDLEAVKGKATSLGLAFLAVLEKNNWVVASFSKD